MVCWWCCFDDVLLHDGLCCTCFEVWVLLCDFGDVLVLILYILLNVSLWDACNLVVL